MLLHQRWKCGAAVTVGGLMVAGFVLVETYVQLNSDFSISETLSLVEPVDKANKPAPSGRRLFYPDDRVIGKWLPGGEIEDYDNGLYKHAPVVRKLGIIVHIIGVMYMLVGLNTVCDIYFCGALDEMVEKWQVKPDVAGATFMAAGGSAPELFTSLIGALGTESDVGFGTIVGSAVFNVLAVIGCCGLVAQEPIKLSWWPLFRDCSFYVVGLSLLALFANGPVTTAPTGEKVGGGEIVLYEALVLFACYLVYCMLMYHNERIEAMVKGLVGRKDSSQVTPVEDVAAGEAKPTAPTSAAPKLRDTSEGEAPPEAGVEAPAGCSSPSDSMAVESTPTGGSSPPAVAKVPTAGSCWTMYPSPPSPEASWGSKSPQRSTSPNLRRAETLVTAANLRRAQHHSHTVHHHHHHGDPDEQAKVSMYGIRSNSKLSVQAQHRSTSKTSVSSLSGPSPHRQPPPCQPHLITIQSQQQMSAEEADAAAGPVAVVADAEQEDDNTSEDSDDDTLELVTMPEDTKQRIMWLLCLPVYGALYYGIPRPTPRTFLRTFCSALIFIAGFSYFLVYCVEMFSLAILGGGNNVTVVMSFTLLAAGTSIPDLVSSMAVAKIGEGDMAVSSSIGSNIFDILVGLPLPWILKIGIVEGAVNGNANAVVRIGSPFIFWYVLLLLAMVALVILCIMLNKWYLNKWLGVMMGFLYVIFLGIVLPMELTNQPD